MRPVARHLMENVYNARRKWAGGIMRKQSRLTLVVGVAVVLMMMISACGSTGNGGTTPTVSTGGTTPSPGLSCATGNITVAGSTALQPLAQAVAQKYQAKCSGAT